MRVVIRARQNVYADFLDLEDEPYDWNNELMHKWIAKERKVYVEHKGKKLGLLRWTEQSKRDPTYLERERERVKDRYYNGTENDKYRYVKKT